MVEGTPLLREHTAYTRIEGSNPSISASYLSKLAQNSTETRMFKRIAGFLLSKAFQTTALGSTPLSGAHDWARFPGCGVHHSA